MRCGPAKCRRAAVSSAEIARRLQPAPPFARPTRARKPVPFSGRLMLAARVSQAALAAGPLQRLVYAEGRTNGSVRGMPRHVVPERLDDASPPPANTPAAVSSGYAVLAIALQIALCAGGLARDDGVLGKRLWYAIAAASAAAVLTGTWGEFRGRRIGSGRCSGWLSCRRADA